jgi:peptide/nickel transport system ATP-binding protein
MNNKPLLEVKNLVTTFRTDGGIVKAVDNLSFTLHKGQTIGIVGESGSGKSVTSLSIMQLLAKGIGKISEGQIIYHHNDTQINLEKLSDKEMCNYRGNEIAMIFQEPMTSLNPVMTCGNQIIETLVLHKKITRKEAEKQTLALFQQVKLPRPDYMLHAYPHQLSGGQKQRVMIAMAMSCNPRVLIADEPTTALDVTIQKNILELMQDLQQENEMGILFISHDLGVIAELADTIIVMYKGKIVEQGHVLDIFSNPQHPYTKSLLACRPPLNKKLHWLPTVADFMEIDAQGAIIAKETNINAVLGKLMINEHEHKARLATLYEQEPILQVKKLNVEYVIKRNIFGKTTASYKAVKDISFDVYPGETLGLVGESGCGKTTLGRAILQLIKATSGQLLFEGKDLAKMDSKQLQLMRKDIQIIFQDPYSSLNPRLSIGEALMEPMRVHNILSNETERKQRVLELLKRVNMLPAHFNRYPHEFSGGQRQRICIARALVLNPKFIICDESVSALDVSVQAQVLNLLNELKDEFKLSYIFISHDLSVVKFMSDRMIVMNAGVVEELGTPDDIYSAPKSAYTQRLINALPKGELADIQCAIQQRKQKEIQH